MNTSMTQFRPKGLEAGGFTQSLKVFISALLCLSLVFLMSMPSTSYAATSYVSLTGIDYYNGLDHTTGMTIDGNQATCLNHYQDAPAGLAVTSSDAIEDEAIRKALYYGNGGPADDGTWDRVQTAIACSMAYSGNGTAYDNDDAEAFYYALDDYENPPDSFAVTLWISADGYQNVATWEYEPYGSIELTKESSNTSISAANTCYSVAGAVYGVYSNSSCTDEVARLTTDSTGYAYVDEIPPGTYYVKEITASIGMALDSSVYTVKVQGESTTAVNGGIVYDAPLSDPVGMLVSKVDATSNANTAQGAASLSGAEFTIEYYDGYYTTAEEAQASGEPTNTWVFATDSDGFAYYAEEYQVSGDSLYYQTNGDATIPLGTILVTETKAPEGYNLDDGAGSEPKTFVIQITEDNAVGESVYTYNTPEIPDSVQRGDYRLIKEVPTTNDEEDQELTRIVMEGVEFQIINDNDEAVISPETNEEVEPGGVVCTITTDENGFASTADICPEDWVGSLAYGTYTVHEVIPDDVAEYVYDTYGITLIAVDDWKMTISKDGQYDMVQLVSNHIPQTPITIEKIDSTTGNIIPLASSFQIYDSEGNLVTYTDHYSNEVLDTWTTLESGACTLPMKLDEGTYYLREVAAPEGYVLGNEDIEFSVTEYNTWENPITITYADDPIYGEIEIMKSDADTDEPVANAEYCIKALGDIVTGDGTVRFTDGEIVGYVTTDDEGKALVENLYLGTYTIYETKSPDGYTLDTKEYVVTISSEGELVPIVTESLNVTNLPTTLQILKVAENDETSVLSGATFRIWQTDDEGVTVFETEETTNELGVIELSYLSHGSYFIEEIIAPTGYYLPEEALMTTFVVDDQGFIGLSDEGSTRSDTLVLTFTNSPTVLDISKTDFTTGTELPGATLQLFDSEENLIEEWVSTNEPYRITGLAPGDYTLVETIAPEGYFISESVSFTLEDSGATQSVEMQNDYTKVSISKTDITTGEELEGASLSIIDADGQTIAEWVSTNEPYLINGLEPGVYTLREITAPEGYEIAEDVEFIVEATGEIQTVVMQDSPTTQDEMPKTGDSSIWLAALLGSIIAGGGVVLATLKIRKSNQDEALSQTVPQETDLF